MMTPNRTNLDALCSVAEDCVASGTCRQVPNITGHAPVTPCRATTRHDKLVIIAKQIWTYLASMDDSSYKIRVQLQLKIQHYSVLNRVPAAAKN
jgi:hypothetical protein